MKGLVIYTYVIFGLMLIYGFTEPSLDYLWGMALLLPMLAMAILWHVQDSKKNKSIDK